MRCLNCGSENQPNATVCCRCGRPLAGAPENNYAAMAGQANDGANASKATRVFTPADLAAMSAEAKATRVFNPQDLNNMLGQTGQANQAGSQQKATRVFSSQDLANLANGMSEVKPKNTRLEGAPVCPRCGNIVDPEATNCMFCGAPLKEGQEQQSESQSQEQLQSAGQEQKSTQEEKVSLFDIPKSVTCPECGTEVSLDFAFCPQCGTRMPKNTIRVSTRHAKETVEEEPVPVEPATKCTLTLIPEDGEQTEAITQTYEGEEVLLNRLNTEPTNRTITSREQARITHEDGHWYVEDLSDMKSTFVHVGRKMEILHGDVILLGNRCFKFESDDAAVAE